MDEHKQKWFWAIVDGMKCVALSPEYGSYSWRCVVPSRFIPDEKRNVFSILMQVTLHTDKVEAQWGTISDALMAEFLEYGSKMPHKSDWPK